MPKPDDLQQIDLTLTVFRVSVPMAPSHPQYQSQTPLCSGLVLWEGLMNTSSCLLHLEGGGVPGLQASPLLVHLVLKRECMPGKYSPNKATASAPNPSLPYWSLYPVLQGCFSPLPHLLLCPCPPWSSITSQFPLPETQSSLRSETLNLLCLHSRHLKAT